MIFKNALGKFTPNHPLKHVITSTKLFLIASQTGESIEKDRNQVVWQSKWILKILRQTFLVFLDTEKCAKNISSTWTLYNRNNNNKMEGPCNVNTLGNWFSDSEICRMKTVFWRCTYTLSGLLSNTSEPQRTDLLGAKKNSSKCACQQTFTSSKSRIEILKNVRNMLKVNNKDRRMASSTSFWYLYC